jgi:transcriptional regulator with XRE-family HTH domain
MAKKKARARRAKPKTRARRARPMRILDVRDKGGRPSKYVAQYAHIAGVMAAGGQTLAEIARALDVSLDTLWRWRRENPEFSDALKTAREIATSRVEQSLYHRAIGYEHESTKILQNGGQVIAVKHTEHYPPDPASAIFWLKNCAPDRWREKPIAPEDADPAKPEHHMTLEELHAELAALEHERIGLAKLLELPLTAAKKNGHGNGHG